MLLNNTISITIELENLDNRSNTTTLKDDIEINSLLENKMRCRHIDLKNQSVGERFPKARNRSKRKCINSYLVGLALRSRQEFLVLLTLYLDKTIIITNTKIKWFVQIRPSRSTHRLTMSIQHITIIE